MVSQDSCNVLVAREIGRKMIKRFLRKICGGKFYLARAGMRAGNEIIARGRLPEQVAAVIARRACGYEACGGKRSYCSCRAQVAGDASHNKKT